MGRTLEHFAWNHVVRALGHPPAVDFVPSAKNAPFKEFLTNLKPEMESFYEQR
jgi:hypothetical protein